MEKDFDKWNDLKKEIDKSNRVVYANQREIWWCSFGLNIGTELYGKNELFERPVLILKVYNKDTLKVIPLTSKKHNSKYYSGVLLYERITSYASFTQTKTISTKRLSRKIGRINKEQFKIIVQNYKDSF
ncbi:MAG: hypothetical protein JWM92_126 [Candidatus Nomurabacteria bacterium]|jgi:mRNA interferase MazF|nr:hypothetical protein [Candidatus Nomurabacteria bacterium]